MNISSIFSGLRSQPSITSPEREAPAPGPTAPSPAPGGDSVQLSSEAQEAMNANELRCGNDWRCHQQLRIRGLATA